MPNNNNNRKPGAVLPGQPAPGAYPVARRAPGGPPAWRRMRNGDNGRLELAPGVPTTTTNRRLELAAPTAAQNGTRASYENDREPLPASRGTPEDDTITVQTPCAYPVESTEFHLSRTVEERLSAQSNTTTQNQVSLSPQNVIAEQNSLQEVLSPVEGDGTQQQVDDNANDQHAGADNLEKKERLPWWKTYKFLALLILCLLILIGLGVGLGIAFSGSSGGDAETAGAQQSVPPGPSANPTIQQPVAVAPAPIQPPTLMPSMAMLSPTTPAPQPPTMAPTSRLDILQELVFPISGYSYQVPGSPQARAMDWILQNRAQEIDATNNRSRERLLELYATLTIYFSTNGPQWRRQFRFLDASRDVCQWHGVDGVTCDEDERINVLFLDSNNLVGSIPPEIAALTRMELFTVSNNGISGRIPSEIGLLPALTLLYLDSNDLVGSLPPELARDQNLLDLVVSFNPMLQGPIPTEFGELERLEMLKLNNNDLQGRLPSELGRLHALHTLWVENNHGLLGRVPEEWNEMEALNSVDLSGTQIGGDLSDVFCQDASRTYEFLIADCFPSDPVSSGRVRCSCCTDCCGNLFLGCVYMGL